MDNLSRKINFNYKFLVEKHFFTTAKEIDIPLLLSVDADFKIFINDELYFDEPIAIFEFYYVLYKWKVANANTKEIQSFNYYSIEYDESVYADGAIISVLPNANTAQVKILWEKNNLNNLFDLNYIVEKFIKLEKDLRENLETYFGIDIFELLKKASYI